MTLTDEQNNRRREARIATDPLLQPFRLKHLTLKNRVMSTSHAISYQEDGKPKSRYQLYHEEKAKGGIALTMFGGASNIAPDSASVFGQLDVSDDSIVPYFEEFSERIHRYDCALMCQLTHMGRRTTSYGGNWLPAIAPSRTRDAYIRTFPREMDEDDIARVVQAFADAAYRCFQGGLDGCEVLAESHLVGQFMSPHSNKRNDRFGGSLENRLTFPLMVLEAIRRKVGNAFVVGIRTSIHEGGDGLQMEECREIVEKLERSGFLDFFNLVYGRLDSARAMAEENMPGIAFPIAPFLNKVGEFKRGLHLPVFHAARITDVATARYAVREGLLDLVGMTRAHIADPHIVNKIIEGEEERIRPCVGATYCMTPRRACIHNAATGREAALPHMINRSAGPRKKIVVVGGGPAGMEAARVSALRGHDVTLFEAAGALGGQVLIAARATWRADLKSIVDWLASELERLHVSVHLNRYMDSESVSAESPDIVVVATGGIPDLEWLDGAAHVTSTWDALMGTLPSGGSVLVYDSLGQNHAGSCAEVVARRGAKVELVTPDAIFGPELGWSDQTIQKQRLYKQSVLISTDRRLLKVDLKDNNLHAVLQNVLTDELEERVVDSVIIESGTVPVTELFEELRTNSTNSGTVDLSALLAGNQQKITKNPTGKFQLFSVGDAVSSRDLHSAILDSLRLCTTF